MIKYSKDKINFTKEAFIAVSFAIIILTAEFFFSSGNSILLVDKLIFSVIWKVSVIFILRLLYLNFKRSK